MSATLNTFPAVNTFNSPSVWVMAIIALLHLGFFWVLTAGLSKSITISQPPTTKVVIPADPVEPRHTPPPPPNYVVQGHVFTTRIPDPSPLPQDPESTAPRDVTQDSSPPSNAGEHEAQPMPVEVEPEIDPRRGLSEPVYPSAAIRDDIEGTVVLSVQVLENGRIGDVRVDKSSGDKRLDDSAVREARRWRLVAGTRDGVPAVLWKQIPITFRLQSTRR